MDCGPFGAVFRFQAWHLPAVASTVLWHVRAGAPVRGGPSLATACLLDAQGLHAYQREKSWLPHPLGRKDSEHRSPRIPWNESTYSVDSRPPTLRRSASYEPQRRMPSGRASLPC